MATNIVLLWTAIIALSDAAMLPTLQTHFGRNNLQNSNYQNDYAVQDRPNGDQKVQGVVRSEDAVRSSVQSYNSPVPSENYGTNAPVENAFVGRNEQTVASVAPIEFVNYKHPEYVDYSSYLYPLYPATYYTDYY
ncbi:hypothetical protein PPYR_06451 [Photinus pyralis]|uniref:Uncharacterized protein n=1 Tax=Photinus pyralis TaxID=7054 RepID=A0A1Y1M8E2_PHOPY|nr:uncharacterized protein LOC116166752 [Photinus pyralis]KAB0800712.1 hypothetical protein PPYR_06451 [Photinus pyralis]